MTRLRKNRIGLKNYVFVLFFCVLTYEIGVISSIMKTGCKPVTYPACLLTIRYTGHTSGLLFIWVFFTVGSKVHNIHGLDPKHPFFCCIRQIYFSLG